MPSAHSVPAAWVRSLRRSSASAASSILAATGGGLDQLGQRPHRHCQLIVRARAFGVGQRRVVAGRRRCRRARARARRTSASSRHRARSPAARSSRRSAQQRPSSPRKPARVSRADADRFRAGRLGDRLGLLEQRFRAHRDRRRRCATTPGNRARAEAGPARLARGPVRRCGVARRAASRGRTDRRRRDGQTRASGRPAPRDALVAQCAQGTLEQFLRAPTWPSVKRTASAATSRSIGRGAPSGGGAWRAASAARRIGRRRVDRRRSPLAAP